MSGDNPIVTGRKRRCPKRYCSGTLGVIEERVENGSGHHATRLRCGECGHEVIRG